MLDLHRDPGRALAVPASCYPAVRPACPAVGGPLSTHLRGRVLAPPSRVWLKACSWGRTAHPANARPTRPGVSPSTVPKQRRPDHHARRHRRQHRRKPRERRPRPIRLRRRILIRRPLSLGRLLQSRRHRHPRHRISLRLIRQLLNRERLARQPSSDLLQRAVDRREMLIVTCEPRRDLPRQMTPLIRVTRRLSHDARSDSPAAPAAPPEPTPDAPAPHPAIAPTPTTPPHPQPQPTPTPHAPAPAPPSPPPSPQTAPPASPARLPAEPAYGATADASGPPATLCAVAAKSMALPVVRIANPRCWLLSLLACS